MLYPILSSVMKSVVFLTIADLVADIIALGLSFLVEAVVVLSLYPTC
jgi:hypothetical protein